MTNYRGVIAEKKNDELFAINTTGDVTIAKKYLREHKRLKVDEILSARSAVPAVSLRKRASDAVGDGILPAKRKKKDFVPQKDLDRLNAIAFGGEQAVTTLSAKKSDDIVEADPWADDTPKEKNPKLSFIEEVVAVKPVKEPPTLKTQPVSLSATGRPLPAIKKPDPGISYNPDNESWSTLLDKEGERVVEEEKKRLAELAEERRIAALAETVDDNMVREDEDYDSSSSEDEEIEKPIKKKIPERKTQAERNRQKRAREAERKLAEEKRKKQLRRELELVKKYQKEIEEREQKKKELALAKQSEPISEEELHRLRRKKFGKVPLPAPPIEVQLPEELAESLRTLKPANNLLKDRYRSLRERGVVETRQYIPNAKTKKLKATEKWSFKDFK